MSRPVTPFRSRAAALRYQPTYGRYGLFTLPCGGFLPWHTWPGDISRRVNDRYGREVDAAAVTIARDEELTATSEGAVA